VKPCPTCGLPVAWMAQHRRCWKWEAARRTAQDAEHRLRLMARPTRKEAMKKKPKPKKPKKPVHAQAE
jgi:hypothetical protein